MSQLLIFLLLLVVVGRARVHVVRTDDDCSVDINALVGDWESPTTLDVVLMARHNPQRTQASFYRLLDDAVPASDTPLAMVTFDCEKRFVFVHFSDMRCRLGCALERVDELMASVDALDPRESFTIKTRRVLDDLEHWHHERACALPPDVLLAAAFFLCLRLVSYCVCERMSRRAA